MVGTHQRGLEGATVQGAGEYVALVQLLDAQHQAQQHQEGQRGVLQQGHDDDDPQKAVVQQLQPRTAATVPGRSQLKPRSASSRPVSSSGAQSTKA